MLGGKPIHINSAYRGDAVNRAVGGVPNSAHTLGYAVDFVCPGFGDPFAIASAIAGSKIQVDQVINEHTWVHVSFDPRYRGERLTLRTNGGYVSGIHR
jgi:putative chitinase